MTATRPAAGSRSAWRWADRAGALAALAPLMARRDPATERVRAFVLALVGDVAAPGAWSTRRCPGPPRTWSRSSTNWRRCAPTRRPRRSISAFSPTPARSSSPRSLRRIAPRRPAAAARSPRGRPSARRRAGSQATPAGRVARASTFPLDRREPRQVRPATARRRRPSRRSSSARFGRPPRRCSAARRCQRPPPPSRRGRNGRPIRPVAAPRSRRQPQPPPVEVAAATVTPAVDRLSDIDRHAGIDRRTDRPDSDHHRPTKPRPRRAPAVQIRNRSLPRAAAKKGKPKLEAAELDASAKKAKPAESCQVARKILGPARRRRRRPSGCRTNISASRARSRPCSPSAPPMSRSEGLDAAAGRPVQERE